MKKVFLCFLILCAFNVYPIFSQDFFGQLTYPDGSAQQVSAVDSTDILYVGLWGKGLKKSLDGGTTWSDANNGLTNYFFNDIFVNKDNKIFISTLGGIYLSTNQGSNWTSINNGLGILNVTCVRQYRSGMLLAGTYGKGIYISTNGGTNWIQSDNGIPYKAISSIEITSAGFILASTYGAGVYQSRDTARTWERVNSGLTNKYIKHLVKIVQYPQVYAATNGAGVYMSPNEGITWGESEDTTGLLDKSITALVIDNDMEEIIGTRNAGVQYYDKYLWNQWRSPFQPHIGVTTMTRSKTGTIYSFGNEVQPMYSTNDGRNWKQMTSLRNEYPIKFNVWGKGKILAQYSNETVKFSSDYGITWQNTDLGSKKLNSACSVENNVIFAGTDSGLFKSTNGVNWTPTSITNPVKGIDYKSGLLALETESLPSGDPPPPPTYSLYTSIDYGATFVQKVFPGDSHHIAKIKISSSADIYMVSGNDIWRSDDQGTTWQNMTLGIEENVNDVALNSSDNVFIASSNGVYRSQNRGITWTYSKLHYQHIDSIGAYKINITKDNTIYVIGNIPRSLSIAYGLWRSTDNGNTWDSLYSDLTSSFYLDLASDDESNLYYVSTSMFKHLNPSQMVIPANLMPENYSKYANISQNFTWTQVPKAELYEWQLSEFLDFSVLKSWVVQSDTSHSSELDYNKTYYWRVRAKYHDSYSDWSSVFTFSTILNAPILISPSNNSLGIPLNTSFLWNKVTNSEYYHLQLAEDDQFTQLIMDVDSLTDTTLVSTTLSVDKMYFWKVKAFNQYGESPWSDIWNFQTTFGAPILISPNNDSLDIPLNSKLVWSDVGSATYYNVMLSDSANFNQASTFKVTTGTSFNLQSHIDYDRDYYWKVQAGNPNQQSEYSAPWHFTSIIAPLNLLAPVNDAKTISLISDFSWTSNEKYDSYEFLLSKFSSFQSILLDTLITSPNVTIKNLEGYTKYFWKVRVKNDTRAGEFSQTWNFTTEIAPVGLRFPTNNSKDNKTTIQFIWFASNGGKYYFLQVAHDANFNDLIISKDSIQSTSYEVKNLLPNTTFYWRVRTSNNDGTSSWSQVWIFQTGSPVPILRFPENDAIKVPLELTFLWDSVENATSYFFQLSTDPTFTQLVQSLEGIPTNSQTVTDLLINTTYYWRVLAKFDDITGNWSDVWVFRTITSGIYETTIDNSSIIIYPNPVSSVLYLDNKLDYIGNCEIIILDAFSRKIRTLYNGLSSNILNTSSYSLGDLAPGIYFLEFKTDNKTYIRKFILLK